MILIAVFALLLTAIPFLWRIIRRRRLNRLLAVQLRQSLQNMVHALQVGTSFLQALDRAAQEGEDPLAREWKTVIKAVQMGTPMPKALNDLGQRVPLKEMAWFVTAAQIAQETGGSLASVLDALANTLQERETLREKVAALTAQGKASGALLGALPFLMLGALYLIAPDMVLPLFTTSMGQIMLAGVVVMVSIGGLVILKIVSIKAD